MFPAPAPAAPDGDHHDVGDRDRREDTAENGEREIVVPDRQECQDGRARQAKARQHETQVERALRTPGIGHTH